MIRRTAEVFALLIASVSSAFAGGPLEVGGPNYGTEGKPITWDMAAMPIQYRVDGGPMAKIGTGAPAVDNATGVARVKNMFATWENVTTASVRTQNAGPIKPSGKFTGTDVSSASDFDAVLGSCTSGEQSPIIFDATGTIVRDLGLPPDVIGFASICKVDATAGHILSGFALLNGAFQDNVDINTNFELSTAQFNEAITHEFGHLLGLDHSQINESVLKSTSGCRVDDLAGLPLMFPVSYCDARTQAGLPMLAPDDEAWISKLYPASTTAEKYGTISGIVYFSDGQSPAQGVNVIARRVDDPATPENESLRIAVSVVSGYAFTSNLGQSVGGDNKNGSIRGSRKVEMVGYFEIPVTPGEYTVEVSPILNAFSGGSSVGPLDPPIPPQTAKYWRQDGTAYDSPYDFDTVKVAPGANVSGIDIILNGTLTRFDQYEDEGPSGARLDRVLESEDTEVMA